MSSILITGANRGIGLGLVKEFLRIGGAGLGHIFATTRDVAKSTDLTSISDERLHVIEMDVLNDLSIEKAAEQISATTSAGGLQLLINNSGVLSSYSTTTVPIDRARVAHHFEVNAVAPVIVTQSFLPLLRRGAASSSAGVARVVNISSVLGSIAQSAGSGPKGYLPYNMSKAAVNMFSKSAAIDLAADKIEVVSIHPGWVQTDMGGKQATLTVEDSARDIVASIGRLSSEHNGGFFTNKLETIPF